MKRITFALVFIFCFCHFTVFAQSKVDSGGAAGGGAAAAKKPRPMSWRDVPSWKYVPPQKVELSPDGKWLAWPLLTTEGEGELILKSVNDTTTRKYAVGGDGQAGFEFSE